MTGLLLADPPMQARVRRADVLRAWPLTVAVLGFPLWWLLGLGAVAPVLAAVPMAVQLMRKPDIRVPRGSAWWGLFLVWLLASVLVLWVDAPGAVPGGEVTRLFVYAYRVVWYVACTVVLLWIGNAEPEEVPTARVVDLMAWLFLFTVAGGLLGTLMPNFDVTSVTEAVLPRSIASNSFVRDLIHPAAAAQTAFLGYTEYRPIAPFAYANTWGAGYAFTLPFFIAGWMTKNAGRARRLAAPVVLVVSAVPVVNSLNRALWGAIIVVGLYGVVRLGLRGHTRAFLGSIVALGIAAGVFMASPLAEDVVIRLEHAHSNDRRSDLLVATVRSTLEGSPVVGFGSTRDVQGGFASIAAGSTPDCPACGVPPLGTQGLLWTVIFAQGIGGAVFFLLFFLRRARAHWRSRTVVESVAVAALLSFVISLPVYDTLGIPMFVVMIGLGLAWRETRQRRFESDHALGTVLDRVRTAAVPIIGLMLVGALVAGVAALRQPPEYAARSTLLLAPVPVSLDPSTGTLRKTGAITIDTEAALVVSAETLSRLTSDADEQEVVRSRITITAPPNTDVIVIEYRDAAPRRAEQVVEAIASSYLQVRAEYLGLRRDQVLRSLDEQLSQLLAAPGGTGSEATAAESTLRNYIDTIQRTPTAAGEELRSPVAFRVRSQIEVPIASGILLGLLAGLLLAAGTGWRRPPTPRILGPRHATAPSVRPPTRERPAHTDR